MHSPRSSVSVRPAPAFRLLGLAVAAAALALALVASPALAGEYEARICAAPGVGGEGVSVTSEGGSGVSTFCGSAADERLRQASAGGSVSGGQRWTLNAPAGTSIQSLHLDLHFGHDAPSFLTWALDAGSTQLSFADAGTALPADQTLTRPVNSTLVRGRLFCAEIECFGGVFAVELRNVVATLRDDALPAVTAGPGGPILDPGDVSGIREVTYAAADAGSGIAFATVLVDGVEQGRVSDPNGGRCQLPYRFLVPCRLDVVGSLAFDSRAVPDGRHDIQVAVIDAAGGRAVSATVPVTVHNTPVNTSRPLLSGSASVGGRLTASPGRWENGPTEFAFQWFRCPPGASTVSACQPLPGETRDSYVPTAADLGQRLLVQVSASNRSGAVTALSAPSETVQAGGKDGAVLSRVSLSRTRFRIGKGGAATSLKLTAGRAGRLSMRLERVRGKRATRVAQLHADVKAGRSIVPISGKIGGRPLRPGRYRLTVTLSSGKRALADPVKLYFTVLPG